MSAFSKLVLSNIRLLCFAFLVGSCATFISSIGLLKRKNWGRIIFIGIMSLGIASNVFALVLQELMMRPMLEMPDPPGSNFGVVMTIARVVSVLAVLGVSIFYGWIIKKLASRKIRQEFMPETLKDLPTMG